VSVAGSAFNPTRLLITGGAGFIGSTVVRDVLRRTSAPESRPENRLEKVVVLDLLTYAGHLANLDFDAARDGVAKDARYTFVQGDICDRDLVAKLFREHAFDAVLHLAAESHVDRSIEAAEEFIRTNVNGTFTLIDAARRAWDGATAPRRFVHVSTDEVYGALGPTGYFTETTPYAPNSPYAASKAASDLLVRSFFKTYGVPTVITNTCNNYGPRQLPEKLIPLMITNAAEGKKLPVYGEGKQIREWIHVEDHADGLWTALTRGTPGESYNFGSGEETSNLEIVHRIADLVDAELGRPAGTARALMTYVPDRKGHDFRYALDVSKVERELGWKGKHAFGPSLLATVRWYLANEAWRKSVSTEEHKRFQAAYYAEGKRA
jgi:dTDP-glucose 4,6-dehydratase